MRRPGTAGTIRAVPGPFAAPSAPPIADEPWVREVSVLFSPPIHRISVGVLSVALLLVTACDKQEELRRSERRIVVGAPAAGFCPLPDADSTVNVQATVYGLDGSVASGVDVTMTTSDGLFPNGTQTEVVRTGEAGFANIVLTTRRPLDDRIVVTGTLNDGREDSVQLSAPPDGRTLLVASDSSIAVGDEVSVIMPASNLCYIREVLLTVRYNPAVVEYVDSAEAGLLNDLDAAGLPIRTDLYVVDSGTGILSIRYSRLDSPPTGVVISGNVLGVRFRGIAPGDAEIYIEDVSLVPLDGRPYAVTNETDSASALPITVSEAATVARW